MNVISIKCTECGAHFNTLEGERSRCPDCKYVQGSPKPEPVNELKSSPNPKDIIGQTKPPIHLVSPAATIYEAMVMSLGAAKYGPYNWRSHPVLLTVYISASQRHTLALLDGQDNDPESGYPHAAHARACNSIILDAFATGNLIDDRPKPGAAARLIEEFTRRGTTPEAELARIRALSKQDDITRATEERLEQIAREVQHKHQQQEKFGV